MTVTDLSPFTAAQRATVPSRRDITRTLPPPRPRDRVTTPAVVSVPAPRVHPRLLHASVALALVGSISILGAAWTDTGRASWFESLDQPGFSGSAPVVLGLGWTVVCAAMALGIWLVVPRRDRRHDVRGAFVACSAQVALLMGWTWTFFVAQRLERAMVVAVALILASTLTVVAFGRVSRTAGALMVPALAWALAVASLTGSLVVLN
jgi:tryptophan-rich sensory protein